MEVVAKYFCLNHDDENGTETFETYNTAEEVLYAYWHIQTTGTHMPQNGDGEVTPIDKEKISIDVELIDENGNMTYDTLNNHVSYLN